MKKKAGEIPEVGALVVGVVTKIFAHGAFVELEDFDAEVMIHISEISPKWIKNIRDFVQEGKIVVAKILRINREKGYIDATLKGVSEDLKRKTLEARKNEQKAMKMLKSIAERLGKKPEEAYAKVGLKLEEKYGRIYPGLEAAAQDSEALKNAGVDAAWLEPVQKLVTEQIQPRFVDIDGYLKLTNAGPQGVEAIRNALVAAEKEETHSEEVKIQYVGAPMYRIKVKSKDYKTAEADLRKVADAAIAINEKEKGEGEFYRQLEKAPKSD